MRLRIQLTEQERQLSLRLTEHFQHSRFKRGEEMELSSAFTVVFSLLMKNLSPFDSSCISFKGIPLQFPTPSQPARAPRTRLSHTTHISNDSFFSHFHYRLRGKKKKKRYSEACFSYHRLLFLSGFLFYFSPSLML